MLHLVLILGIYRSNTIVESNNKFRKVDKNIAIFIIAQALTKNNSQCYFFYIVANYPVSSQTVPDFSLSHCPQWNCTLSIVCPGNDKLCICLPCMICQMLPLF